MKKENYIAKSAKKNQYEAESLESHTNKLINLFEDFLQKYSNKFDKKDINLIRVACEKHDLGKLNYRFQKYLYQKSKLSFMENTMIEKFYHSKNIENIPHGVLSCCFLDSNELKENYGFDRFDIQILASSIYNHHNRQFNLTDSNKLKEIIELDLKPNAENYGLKYCDGNGIGKNKLVNNILEVSHDYAYNFWLKFAVIKGMLNKLDYAASAGLDTLEIEANNAHEYIKKYFDTNGYKLNECQKFMSENSEKSIVVIASTGIGKTEGALLWAGSSKTFYTLPIKVSINAIYKRIIDNNYYGESKEDKNKVSFLHSDTRSMMMKHYSENKNEDNDEDDYERKYIETRQLIHPFTVCTLDQLFYFVFKSLGTEKFIATLKYSKVIIDEIQSYSPDIIAFIIYGLKVIVDLGGQFLIMTATLPPVVKYFLIEKIGEEKIKIADKPYLKKDENGNIIQRHFIKYVESDFNYSEIIKQAENKKVLVICNTVKSSQAVYSRLKELSNSIDINLLHSRFILKDRREKEKDILEFAKSNKTGIWISTQIVEASLDIDFDILYTDMCTADSLLQRMGRCYRNRQYDNSREANVFIYYNKEDKKAIGVGSVYDEDIFNFSVEHIEKYNGNFFSEEEKQEYINNVYNVEKLECTKYYKTIKYNLDTLEKLSVGGVNKDITERQFRNINNITVIPIMFKPDVEKLLEELESIGDKKERYIKIDEIKNYTTSIFYNKNYKENIERFEKGRVKEKYLNNILYIDLPYEKETGIRNRTDDELEEYEEKKREEQFL